MEKKYEYQYNFSDKNDKVLNSKSRQNKAAKIHSVLLETLSNMEDKVCLDIGCSGGIITHLLADYFSEIIGCDIDENAIKFARENLKKNNCSYLVADAMNIPFPDQSFDVIICNHIYEHVPDSSRLVSEIYRLLKSDGICYFAAGNKWNIIEPHYKLPFLSWLPQKLASKYIRLFGKGDYYYEKHLDYNDLLKLLRKFKIHDFTLQILKNPQKYHIADMFMARFFSKWPEWLLKILFPLVPTYVFVLRKK